MLRSLIIDDEADARENLSNLLKKYCPDVDVISEESSAIDGFEAIKSQKPDLVFLDINMPEATGIDLLEKIGDINFDIIFVTAYDDYAIKAIKFAALDYLLKPIDILELKSAVTRAAEKQNSNRAKEGLNTLVNNQKGTIKKIGLSTSEGITYISIADIVRCEASDTYTTFFLEGGDKIMISKSLKEYDSLLADYNFFRVHQSHLINLNFVKRYMKGVGGQVEMTDGSIIAVARRKKEPFLNALEEYHQMS